MAGVLTGVIAYHDYLLGVNIGLLDNRCFFHQGVILVGVAQSGKVILRNLEISALVCLNWLFRLEGIDKGECVTKLYRGGHAIKSAPVANPLVSGKPSDS